MPKTKIAVVTGAARGLGFAVAEDLAKKGFTVCMLGRNPSNIEEAATRLQKQGLDVHPFTVDVSAKSDVSRFAEAIRSKYDAVDVLVNNAGVFIDPIDWENESVASIFKVDEDAVEKSFHNNTMSVLMMTKAMAPLLIKSGHGRVVNVSSGMGQLTGMNGHYPGYRLSKTAVNALTRIFSEELQGTGVKVNSVCPGWVKTEMGGENAEREIPDGIKGIVWAALLPDSGPTGEFFRDGEKLDW